MHVTASHDTPYGRDMPIPLEFERGATETHTAVCPPVNQTQQRIKMDNGEEREDETAVQEHPWPYLEELFEFVGAKNNSWRMCCVLCKPKVHEVLALLGFRGRRPPTQDRF